MEAGGREEPGPSHLSGVCKEVTFPSPPNGAPLCAVRRARNNSPSRTPTHSHGSEASLEGPPSTTARPNVSSSVNATFRAATPFSSSSLRAERKSYRKLRPVLNEDEYDGTAAEVTLNEGRPIVVAIRFRPPAKDQELQKERSPGIPSAPRAVSLEKCTDTGESGSFVSNGIPQTFPEKAKCPGSSRTNSPESVSEHPASSSSSSSSFSSSSASFAEWEKAEPWLLNQRDGLVVDAFRNAVYEGDFVFGKSATNAQIYSRVLASLVESFTLGVNASVIAYGQTASGKTHTMFGSAVAVEAGSCKATSSSSECLRESRFSSSTPKRRAEGEAHGSVGEASSKGSLREEGLVAMALADVFAKLSDETKLARRKSTISISMLEVYNERAIDLLRCGSSSSYSSSSSSSLAELKESNEISLRERADGSLDLRNLTASSASSLEEALGIVRKGLLARRVGATALNAKSSRSHTILRVTLTYALSSNLQEGSSLYISEGASKGDAVKASLSDEAAATSESPDGVALEAVPSKMRNSSVLCFVDLAGSEGVARANTQGESQMEGRNINRSLLALSRVVKALSQVRTSVGGTRSSSASSLPTPSPPPPFIGFRESKLTRLLSDCLGGSAITTMICLCAPGTTAYRETTATLEFAKRARSVKAKLDFLCAKRGKRKCCESREASRLASARQSDPTQEKEKEKASSEARTSSSSLPPRPSAPPAFVYIPTACTQCRALHKQLENAREEIAFLKVELRQLRYVLETGSAFRSSEASVAGGGSEEALEGRLEKVSNEAQQQLSVASAQLAVGSVAPHKALSEDLSGSLENQSGNSSKSKQKVAEVDYGGGVCFKKTAVGNAVAQVVSTTL